MKDFKNYSVGDVKISRDHFLNFREGGSISSVGIHGKNLILGTLVRYPGESNMMDIHYFDKYTASNAHPSGYIKLETRRPQKNRILISRLIDRSLRSIVKGMGYQILLRTFSTDKNISPIKAALAVASDLVLQIDAIELPIYPFIYSDRNNHLYVSLYKNRINMVEAVFNRIPQKELINFFRLAFKESKEFTKSIEHSPYNYGEKVLANLSESNLNGAFLREGLELFRRYYRGKDLKYRLNELIERTYSDFPKSNPAIILSMLLKIFNRRSGRYDGRKADEIRPFSTMINPLETPSGSIFVQRGGTKVLTSMVVSDEAQSVDESGLPKFKEFLNVQYDMMGHSNNQIAFMRAHNRREIGHANLIYNAVRSTKLNDINALYIQNEVITCDGSSSLAGVLGTSLNMYLNNLSDELIVGISIGRIEDEFITDIVGLEDWLGEMDFKLCGVNGTVTAIQSDFKNFLPDERDVEAILDLGSRKISEIYDRVKKDIENVPRKDLDADRTILKKEIQSDDLKYVIGFGGFNFKDIESRYSVKVNLNKGSKNVLSLVGDVEDCNQALERICRIIENPDSEGEYSATVMTEIKPNYYLIQPENCRSGFLRSEERLRDRQKINVKVREMDSNRIIFTKID